MLKGKKILIGITGSIAAYKTISLVRLLIKAGAEVKVILTPSAKDFVSPLVLSTLSKNKVAHNLFEEDTWANHVMLGRWADVFLIAPLSCNTLAKMAHGECDNLLLATYLSATCPIIVAPAMDEDMWHHPATKQNIETLRTYGNYVLEVKNGELASGLTGEGRMAEPEEMITELNVFFRTNLFQGKNVLVTAGPTYENIDPVRFIGNFSSGKMGYALAESLYLQGANVMLISGPVHINTVYKDIKIHQVTSAKQMYDACIQHFPTTDMAVMAAAVADYSPAETATEKIKKENEGLTLQLNKTQDILQSLGKIKTPKQLLVGFALETNNELEYARKKLASKNADMIVLNSLRDENAGFNKDTNKVTVIDKGGELWLSNVASKKEIADFIVKIIIDKYFH